MRLVQYFLEQGTELNITGNDGTHYNGVKIVAVYDDFIKVEPASESMRQAGQYRGGHAYINVYTITRLEEGGTGGSVQDSIRRRLR
jgi:hypothetical protein